MKYSNPNVLTQMPSLIQAPFKLDFGLEWPLNLNLPPLQNNTEFNIQDYSQGISQSASQGNSKKRRQAKNTTTRACPHSDKKIFAKQMCHSCYQIRGRDKKAWNCEHKNKPHYAKGMCQLCYLKEYYQNKRDKQQNDQEIVNDQKGINQDSTYNHQNIEQNNKQLEDCVYQPEVVEGVAENSQNKMPQDDNYFLQHQMLLKSNCIYQTQISGGYSFARRIAFIY